MGFRNDKYSAFYVFLLHIRPHVQFSIIPNQSYPKEERNHCKLQPQNVSERLHVVNVSLGIVCFALLPLETDLYELSDLTPVKVKSNTCNDIIPIVIR